ncbi:hypothetical protein [Syntrophus aciditrophicus]|uniref:Hypothetical cytosolic protein n=1 Tax=Syntrophus aciditrophicus (strain SB) TaxID=56780 RepID=Q2LTB0_SYNAS|nr:hypothetical protein [Syntrophus aciditrophicus]ABC77320.1 hypothetical cytosolic protein [Syntrophus aciditrophicus SB]
MSEYDIPSLYLRSRYFFHNQLKHLPIIACTECPGGPVQAALEDRTAKRQATVLPHPRKNGLGRNRISKLPVILSEAAGATGLQTIHVSLEIRRLNEAANSLPVNIILRTEYLKFRDYLIRLKQTV